VALYLFLLAHLATVLHLAQVLQCNNIVIIDVVKVAEDLLEVLLVPASSVFITALGFFIVTKYVSINLTNSCGPWGII